jgi:hypothetical protein
MDCWAAAAEASPAARVVVAAAAGPAGERAVAAGAVVEGPALAKGK